MAEIVFITSAYASMPRTPMDSSRCGKDPRPAVAAKPIPGSGNRLLDVPAAAAYLGVSPRFIRRLVAERRLAFVKLGRHLRFDVVDLDHFIESGRVEPFEPTRRSSRASATG